jgi:hypothetical protein
MKRKRLEAPSPTGAKGASRNPVGRKKKTKIKRNRLTEPLPNGQQTDRNARGQFARGNRGGPGNPGAAQVGRNRARLYKVIRGQDIELAITTIRRVMQKGKDSDRLAAARLLLDRALGPIVSLDFEQRLAELETLLNEEPDRGAE